MTGLLDALDHWLARLSRTGIVAYAVCGVAAVAGIDLLTGYEVSMSLFYLVPVGMVAWYAGRRAGVAVAAVSCFAWYFADLAAGHQYAHPAIAIWNALVRLGYFLVASLLLSALRASLAAQQHLARTDALTGMYGRRAFEDRIGQHFATARRHRRPLSLAYIDLDDFRKVNETRGHPEGDRVLRAIGGVLQRSLRESDTAARIGGDEFALILPDTDDAGAKEVVAKLTRALAETIASGEHGISMSMGVVTVLDPATTPERAVAAADELMYSVKHQGKGAVAYRVLRTAGPPDGGAEAPPR
ncbi:MAG: GGDEF domain-containing protein [Burkholderiales bacterium]